jgi:GNAT superfamily N-acetyltransferase
VSPDSPNAERVTLAPGLDVMIRPIRPEDRHLMTAAFTQLTPQSRYQRFFAPVERLSDSDLTYLTEIDHSRHEALVAIDPEDGGIVGVARYVCLPPPDEQPAEDPEGSELSEGNEVADAIAKGGLGKPGRIAKVNEAEVAVIVGEPWQGKGLATVLLQRLAKRASEEGVDYFVALILEENDGATSLFENLVANGTRVRDGDPGLIEVRIELPGPEAFSDSVLARTLGGYAKGTLRVSPWRRLQRRLAVNRRRRRD